MNTDDQVARHAERLLTEAGRHGPLLVAFSGGADSALMVAAAARALGPDRVLAATGVSGSLAGGELDDAAQFCADLGVRHEAVRTDELSLPGYRENGPDRCAWCKTALMDALVPLAAARGLAAVATGTNADDLVAGFRPGIAAAAAAGAMRPLADAGLDKAAVRAVSHLWQLPTWDKPAAACLSSRVAYGLAITPARLARVDAAEHSLRSALASAGVAAAALRVRDRGDHASVEVDAGAMEAFSARPELLACIVGFDQVRLDPRGYRVGSLNEQLPDQVRASLGAPAS